MMGVNRKTKIGEICINECMPALDQFYGLLSIMNYRFVLKELHTQIKSFVLIKCRYKKGSTDLKND